MAESFLLWVTLPSSMTPLPSLYALQPLCLQSSLPFVKCMNAAPAEIGKLTLAEHCLSNLTSKTLAEEARSCMTGG
jgi:hypothetical protein